MVSRSITSLARLSMVAALVVLGTTASLEVTGTIPATAAGSSTGLFAWGSNDSGQLGDGTSVGPDSCFGQPCSTTPALVQLPSGVTPTAIAAGPYDAYAIGSDGHLYAWGSNQDGELGDGVSGFFNSTTPVVVSLPSGVTPTAIAASNFNGYAIGSDGNLYAWGDNFYGTLGNGTSGPDVCDGIGSPCSTTPVVVSLPSGVTPTAIAGAAGEAYAIGSDGHLYAWGNNHDGDLGDGTDTGPDICGAGGNLTACSRTPVVVSLPSGVTPKAIAGEHAIGSDGHLYAWGSNEGGALGNGTSGGLSTTPVVVSLPSGVTPTAIAASGNPYATGSDGHLYAWGGNNVGQLGIGTNVGPDSCSGESCSTTPVVVSLPSGVTATAISGNGGTAYAIGSDGHLYAWGGNNLGELGDGANVGPETCFTFGCSTTPVVVSLPPGSTPQKLGSGPGLSSGYAIVNAPDVAPTITTQPASQAVVATQDATFTAATSGFPTPTVQWQVSTDGGATFSPVAGATSTTLTIAGTTLAENGNEYEAVFTNGAGSATTNSALLTVNPDTAPVVTVQPANQSGTVGGEAFWTSAASGGPAPTVQWQYSTDGGSSWVDCPYNAMSTTLGIVIWATFENGWEVRAVFTNVAGSATSNSALLTVNPDTAPVVTVQPANQSGTVGGEAFWTSAASGGPAPTVQWQYSTDGGSSWVDCPYNAMSTTLGIVIWATFENGWEVRAVFTNRAGSATSNTALLTVS
ncbi:MAG: hypothetical protein IVW52_18720 [Acidimicrobiales bacterium]|nr:hypothetical protein [Acidimicrobiales bacterium]